MTIESGNKPTGASIKQERLKELLAIDAKIVELVAERGRLLRKESAWRRSKGQPRIDPAFEKGLWAEWEAAAQRLGVGPKLLRQLFNTLNLFGDKTALIKRREGEGYVLRPRIEPMQVLTPAPRSTAETRMWATLAAMTGQSLALDGVILNDPLVELVKALNQVGASLSWTDDSLRHDKREEKRDERRDALPTGPLQFEDKLLFAGDDAANLYLLVAVALSGAGRVKFSGGAGLKLLDITTLNAALPRLGARIVPLNPHGKGLPARLECGGTMQNQLTIDPSLPADFAAALALCAWSYPGGLRMDFSGHPAAAAKIASVAELLKKAGVPVQMRDTECLIPETQPVLPEKPEAGIDAELAAYLLALPALTGGSVTLSGTDASTASSPALAALAEHGLKLENDGCSLTSTVGEAASGDITLGTDPAMLPLALALGLKAGRPVRLSLPEEEQDGYHDAVDEARQFLDRLDADYQFDEDGLVLTPAQLSWEGAWTSPTPHFCLGAALSAFIRPGIALENPGQLTSLWPQFWNIYNTLPTGKMKAAPVKEQAAEKPKRRRIKV